MIAFTAQRDNPLNTAERVAQAHGAASPLTRRAWAVACLTSCTVAAAFDGPLTARVSTCVTGVLLATAALVDVHELRLPNRLLASAFTAALLAAAANGALGRSLLGALVAGGLMLIVALARSVGMGDVKMAGVVGAGVAQVQLVVAPVAIAVAALAAATAGVVLGRSRLPLGPALWLGWAVALAVPVGRWFA